MMEWLRNLVDPLINVSEVKFGDDGAFKTTTTKRTVSTIKINGKTYQGNSVSIINNRVFIDGREQSDEGLTGVVKVEITGDPASVNCDAPLVINGNVHGNVEADGPVTCGAVNGNVEADGPVTCGNVQGNVEADGPCTCGNVGGDVTADMVVKS